MTGFSEMGQQQQISREVEPTSPNLPEQRLYAHIIQDSCKHVFRCESPRWEEEFQWLMTDHPKSRVTFTRCCEVLELDPTTIRKGILRKLKKSAILERRKVYVGGYKATQVIVETSPLPNTCDEMEQLSQERSLEQPLPAMCG